LYIFKPSRGPEASNEAAARGHSNPKNMNRIRRRFWFLAVALNEQKLAIHGVGWEK